MDTLSTAQSQVLYLSLFFVTVFFAYCSQKEEIFFQKVRLLRMSLIPFICSFVLLWVVLCFTNIGSDYASYSMIIERLTWTNYASFYSEEPGINIYFLVIRTLAQENIDASIFLVKTVNISLIYLSLFILRNKINIAYGVLSYVLLLYLPSFYLLSITLSVGICFLGISLYLTRNAKIVCILLILFAAQFHNSAYLFLFSFMAACLFEIKGVSLISKCVITFSYGFAALLSSKIYSLAQMISGFHYNNYGENSFVGSGIMVPVIFIPLAFGVYYSFKYSENSRVNNLFFIFALSSCLFNILSYQFRVIERMEFYYVSIYILIVPFLLHESGIDISYRNGVKKTSIVSFAVICYLFFRGYMVFMERTTSLSGVGHYTFFNPFG